jgi:hypothetical protein
MSHPCDHPLYAAYAKAVRVVFNTTFLSEEEENAAVAAMQEAKRVWEGATL